MVVDIDGQTVFHIQNMDEYGIERHRKTF